MPASGPPFSGLWGADPFSLAWPGLLGGGRLLNGRTSCRRHGLLMQWWWVGGGHCKGSQRVSGSDCVPGGVKVEEVTSWHVLRGQTPQLLRDLWLRC